MESHDQCHGATVRDGDRASHGQSGTGRASGRAAQQHQADSDFTAVASCDSRLSPPAQARSIIMMSDARPLSGESRGVSICNRDFGHGWHGLAGATDIR